MVCWKDYCVFYTERDDSILPIVVGAFGSLPSLQLVRAEDIVAKRAINKK